MVTKMESFPKKNKVGNHKSEMKAPAGCCLLLVNVLEVFVKGLGYLADYWRRCRIVPRKVPVNVSGESRRFQMEVPARYDGVQIKLPSQQMGSTCFNSRLPS